MRFTNECIRFCWLSCVMCLATKAWAQPATVDDAIEAAKKKKSQQAVASTEQLPAALLPPANAQMLPISSVPPKLWSIKGINGDYTAEIIYDQKIHPVKLVTGTRFLQWEIIAFDDDSVTLLHRDSKAKKTKPLNQHESDSKKSLKLFVAPTGNSIATYRIHTGSELNTPQRQAAADLPATPPSRPANN